MTSTEAHPLLADTTKIVEAIELGFGEELPAWCIQKGFGAYFLPPELTGSSFTTLKLVHVSGSPTIDYCFSPKDPDQINPFSVIVASEEGVVSIPAVARFIFETQRELVPIGKRGGFRLTARSMQVDVLENGSVINFNEELKIDPIYGEYDDDRYGFIRSKASDYMRRGWLADMATHFINLQ